MAEEFEKSEEFNLNEILEILKRRKNIIIYFSLLVVILVMGYTFMKTPLYEAKSTILIEREANVLIFKDLYSVESGRWDQKFNSYVKMLRSRSLAERVIKRLKFDSKIPPELSEQEKGKMLSRMVNNLLSHLKVNPIENTRLVVVSYRAPNPKIAAKIVNTLIDEFIQFTVDLKGESAKRASDYLTRQIEKLRKILAEKEKELQKYSQRKDLYYLTDKQNTIVQKFAQLSRAYTQAQINRVNLEANYRELLSKRFDEFPKVAKNPLIISLKAEYSKLEAQYRQKAAIFKPDYPEMRSLKSRMDSIRARIEKETKALGEEELKNARAKYLAALKTEESLRKLVEEQKKQMSFANRSAIYYNSLKIEVKNLRDLLAHLNKKQKESILSANLEGMKTSNIKVVDRAEIPISPATPNKKMNLLLALLLGISGGIFLAFLIDALDNSVKEPEEAERIFNLPILGVAPNINLDGKEDRKISYLHYSDNSNFSEMIKTITTSILLSSPDNPPKAISFTSSIPGEGKTTIAINVGISLAGLGKRTLIIDADLRRGTLHEFFNVENENGLSLLITGIRKKKDVILSTEIPNLQIIPSGPVPPNPVALLSFDRMKEILEELREEYQHIILDVPPLVGISDPIIVSRLADKTILIIWAGKTPKKVIQGSLSTLRKNGINVMGIVLNRMGFRGSGYRKYYRYDYYGYS